LDITARTAGNKIVEMAVLRTRASIAEGKTIAEPLRESGVFPPMVVQMIAVGEQTGALDAMLGKIADFYDEEVDSAVANLTSLLEPMLMVFLASSSRRGHRHVSPDLQARDGRRAVRPSDATLPGGRLRGPRCPFRGPAVTMTSRDSAPRASTGMLGKLKWMVGLRLLLASALLGSAVVLDLHERLPFPTSPLYGLLAVTFGLSLAYAIALRSQRWLSAQGLTQLTLDLVLVSLLVHFSGGLDSVFPFMYIFVIFSAAATTERRGGLVVGILSGLLYAMLVLAEWTQVIRPVEFAGGLAPTAPWGTRRTRS